MPRIPLVQDVASDNVLNCHLPNQPTRVGRFSTHDKVDCGLPRHGGDNKRVRGPVASKRIAEEGDMRVGSDELINGGEWWSMD